MHLASSGKLEDAWVCDPIDQRLFGERCAAGAGLIDGGSTGRNWCHTSAAALFAGSAKTRARNGLRTEPCGLEIEGRCASIQEPYLRFLRLATASPQERGCEHA